MNGNDWIINGQKIWTSGAHYSDYGILLTRTDPNVAQAQGPHHVLPGHEEPRRRDASRSSRPTASPISTKSISPTSRIPDSQRLGEVNDGWNVSLTTLMNERMSIGVGVATGFPELFEFCNSLMLEDGPAIEDRSVRSKLANWAVKASGLKYTSHARDLGAVEGRSPGTGEFDRQAGGGRDGAGCRGLCAGFAGRGRRAERR